LREREDELARAAKKIEKERQELALQSAGTAGEGDAGAVLAEMDEEARAEYVRIREREFAVMERRLQEKQAEVQQHIAANLKMSEVLATSATGAEMSAADVQKMIQNHAEELAHVQEISAARIQRLEEQVERAHGAMDTDKEELQDTIDDLFEKLNAAEAQLLQSMNAVEALNERLRQEEEAALAAEAAAQARYVALKEQMAAREQELVDEMLSKVSSDHSNASAAQGQLEQELRAKKEELKALEERDKQEAKAQGLAKVKRSQSTKDAYWEVERARQDLEKKQGEIAAANQELEELRRKQAEVLASNEDALRDERQRAEAAQRQRMEEMEHEFTQRQAALQLQLATKQALETKLSPANSPRPGLDRRGTEAVLGDLKSEFQLESKLQNKLAGIAEDADGEDGGSAVESPAVVALVAEAARPTTGTRAYVYMCTCLCMRVCVYVHVYMRAYAHAFM